MSADNLKDLYVASLQKMYDGERQLVDALPKMADAASTDDLKNAFQDHREETREHQQRLETILESLQQSRSGDCRGIAALIQEGESTIGSQADDNVKDAALIAVAQQAEHFEIATYGTLCSYAEMLGREDDLRLLQDTLQEEKSADDKLKDIAERVVNPNAQAA